MSPEQPQSPADVGLGMVPIMMIDFFHFMTLIDPLIFSNYKHSGIWPTLPVSKKLVFSFFKDLGCSFDLLVPIQGYGNDGVPDWVQVSRILLPYFLCVWMAMRTCMGCWAGDWNHVDKVKFSQLPDQDRLQLWKAVSLAKVRRAPSLTTQACERAVVAVWIVFWCSWGCQ